jgi:hypothetical protein
MDTAQWWDFSKSLPENLPDSAYDALREQFFKAKVMPEVMQQGFNISTAEREWKDATERPGKKSKKAVLGEIAGKAAIKGLVAPIVGLSGSPELQQSYAQLGQSAETEAARQEISPVLTMGADLAGTAVGMAPYFISPVSGARALGARLADKFAVRALASGAQAPTWAGKRALQTAMEMGVTAPIQGMYDAARTTDGHRMLEGFKGAAIGAGAAGVVEGLGVGLRGLLRNSHGLDAAQAKAVEAVARGVGDDAQGALAASVMQAQPDIQQTVAGWLSEGVQRAKKLGGPLQGLEIEDGGMLHLHMKGADGKPYWLTRLDTSSVDKSVERIAKHLEKGGEILSVKGDPTLINKMYLQFENFFKNEYELPTPLKGGDASTAHLIPEGVSPTKRLPDDIPTGVEPQDVLPEGAAPPPAPPVGTTPLDKLQQGVDDLKTGVGELKSTYTDMQGALAALVQLPDGRVVDKANKLIYDSIEQALKGNGVQYRAQAKPFEERASWFGPKQEKVPLKSMQDHDSVGRTILDPLGIDDGGDPTATMKSIGWVRTRERSVEFDAEFVNSPAVTNAIADVIEHAKYQKLNSIDVDAFGLANVTVPINGTDEYELLMNTKKYLLGRKKGMRFQANRRDFLKRAGGAIAGAAAGGPGKASDALKALAGTPGAEGGFAAAIKSITGFSLKKRVGDYLVIQKEIPSGMTIDQVPGAIRKFFAPRLRHIDYIGGEGLADDQEYVYHLINQLGMDDAPEDLVPLLKAELENAYSIKDLANMGSWESFQGGSNVMLPQLEKRAPGIHKLMKELGQLSDDQLELLESKHGLTSIKSFKSKGDPVEFLKKFKKEFSTTQVEQIQRPTGMELQRTPAQLGEDGSGGVMMRYQANQGGLDDRFMPEEMVDGLVKERPLYKSGSLVPEVAREANGVTQLMGKGQKPIILLSRNLDNARDTVFHENIHGHLDYLGIANHVKQAVASNPKARQLINGLDTGIRNLAGGSEHLLEETAAYLTTAIRVGDDRMLKQFVDADGSLEEVLQTGVEVAHSIKVAALQTPPSLHRQSLLRKMNHVERKAGGIAHLRNEFDKLGRELEVENGKFTTIDNGKKLTFNSRQEVEDYIEQNLLEPLNAPDLWDELFLPNMPKFAARANPKQVPPLTTTPIPPSGPPAGRLKGGVHALSFFFRPFYPWLETVSRKNNWPELYDKFKQLDFGIGEVDKITNTFEKKFVKVFDKLPHSKRHDLYTYFETPDAKKPEMAKTLKLGQKDLDLVERIKTEIINPISSETGHSLNTFIQEFMPAVRQLKGDVDAVKPTKTMSQTDVDFYKQIARGGSIDARDADLLRVLVNYTRDGSQRKVLGAQLDDLDSFINKKNDDGQFVLGSLQPLFRRHLEHIKGNPDRTQYMLNGAMETAIDSLNQAIDGVNKKLPKNKQLEKIELPAEEVMGRFMLFSYAGTLGLRPMTLLRDGMQVITTTYPMLGGTYFKRGMEKAFPTIKGGKQSNPWQVADKYGALMDRADLTNLYSGGQGANIATTAATKISEQMLHGLQWTNNVNRLISFWGHSERMMDSIKKYRHDPKLFAKKSGLIYLDAPLQEKFIKELAETEPSQWQDLAHRAAKELTDVSQWSYRRGAQPGAYKFALGRILGQYGTWPANYVEYGRRIMRSGDGLDKLQTGVRLAAAHYAILKGGEAHGVDTSTWVFNSPMAYQGGPLLTGAMALPQALGDSQTRMGDQARDRLYRIPQVSIPGGLAMSRVYDSIVKDEPDKWKVILGFDPLSESEMKEGMHNLP